MRGGGKELLDEHLIRFAAAPGEPAEARVNADSDSVLGVIGFWAANAARALEFGRGGFGNVREIKTAVRNMLCVPCDLPLAR